MKLEGIVYIARKLHWTLDEIGKLTPRQYNLLLTELCYQESVDEHRKQQTVATILASIANTVPRKRGSTGYKASDFLSGGEPSRGKKKAISTLTELVESMGIKLPKGE